MFNCLSSTFFVSYLTCSKMFSCLYQGTWMLSLRQKFRDARRPMVNDAHVMRRKKKYGFSQNKNLSTSAISSGSAVPAKRAYVVLSVYLGFIV